MPDLQSVRAGPGSSEAEWIVMAGGQGAPETRAGLSRRTKGPSETGDPGQSRLEPRRLREAAKTEGAVAFKPQAPMIRKQLQVGCSVPVSQEGMLVCWLCRFVLGNRSSLFPAQPNILEQIMMMQQKDTR